MITLTAQPRTATGKRSALLREEGLMPAVVYGAKQESLPIAISLREFEAVLRHGGESSLIELSGLEKPLQVLIHDLERDPVTHVPRHADLYAVEKGAKVTVSVPLSFVGESMAVKQGANLVKVMHELEIEAEATNLPQEIEVDISSLNEVGDQILVSAITLPKGVVAMVEGEEVVALAQAVEEETEEESAAPDMDAIEVEKKGKDDTEESE